MKKTSFTWIPEGEDRVLAIYDSELAAFSAAVADYDREKHRFASYPSAKTDKIIIYQIDSSMAEIQERILRHGVEKMVAQMQEDASEWFEHKNMQGSSYPLPDFDTEVIKALKPLVQKHWIFSPEILLKPLYSIPPGPVEVDCGESYEWENLQNND